MNHPSGRRVVSVAITFGELMVELEADGLYSPDSVHDLVGQVIRGFNESLAYLRAHGFAQVLADCEETEGDED